MLVVGEPPAGDLPQSGDVLGGHVAAPVRTAPLAKGCEARLQLRSPGAGRDRIHRAQVIAQQVAERVGSRRLARVKRDRGTVRVDRVLEIIDRAAGDDLEDPAQVDVGVRSAADVQLVIPALPVSAVLELTRVRGTARRLADALWAIVGEPKQLRAAAAGHVAVGVVRQVLRPATRYADRGDRVQLGRVVAVATDCRLAQDVAVEVIREGEGLGGVESDARETVQAVVLERLGERPIEVLTAGEVAGPIPYVLEVLPGRE